MEESKLTKLEKKLIKSEGKEFITKVATMLPSELNLEVGRLAKEREALEEVRDMDPEYASAREAFTLIRKEFNDDIYLTKTKLKYAFLVLQGKE